MREVLEALLDPETARAVSLAWALVGGALAVFVAYLGHCLLEDS